jgi:hypothetical protein
MHLTQEINSTGPDSAPGLNNAAKLHGLGLKLAETRRDLMRSRTVTRLLRDAYRLDDLSSSVDAIPSRFLMLVTENMLCDCAALLRAEPPGGSNYYMVALVGAAPSAVRGTLCLEAMPRYFFTSEKNCQDPIVEVLSAVLGASHLLWVLDVPTGHALILGGRRNATIEQRFCTNDYETVEGALAVYIDVLDRRRTRRLLEQAKQEAEARDGERDGLVVMMADKMRAVLDELTKGFTGLGYDPAVLVPSAHPHILSMVAALTEGRQLLEAAQQLLEEKPSRVILNLEWVSLPDLLLSVVRGAQPGYLQRGVDLRLKPFSRRFRAYVDRIWIEIILNSLLTEALSCVADGAEMAVEARRREDGSIGILISGQNRFSPQQGVSSGPISGEIVFGQAAASTRRLVRAHGAVLTSERPDAATSRFVLSLPSRDCRDE